MAHKVESIRLGLAPWLPEVLKILIAMRRMGFAVTQKDFDRVMREAIIQI